MEDDEGRIYHIVHSDDVIRTEKKLGVSEVSASFIRGDKDLLPEDYGFLHPNYQIDYIYDDEGRRTGFSEISFGHYPIVWEKMTKIAGRHFRKIRVSPKDADEYFQKSEADYQEYQESYKRKKEESRYVVVSTAQWKLRGRTKESMYKNLSVGRIEGAYYYSTDMSKQKKRTSSKDFHIICEIDYDQQKQARQIIQEIRKVEKDNDYLNYLDWWADDQLHYKEKRTELRYRMQSVIQDFTQKEREITRDRLEELEKELMALGKEHEQVIEPGY